MQQLVASQPIFSNFKNMFKTLKIFLPYIVCGSSVFTGLPSFTIHIFAEEWITYMSISLKL